MNLHAFATRRGVIAAAVAMIGVGLTGSSASAFGIKTVGTVVYAQAPAPGYYAAAPGAYGQAPYYLVTNHHKQYIVPAAAFAPQAYAPAAYAPQSYAPQSYAPQMYTSVPSAPAATASAPPTYVYPTTASAPAAAPGTTTTVTTTRVAAAPIGSAPGDDESEEPVTPSEFKLTGAVLQTYKDDLRKFYESSSETGGMAKIKALKDEAKNIYSTYDDSAGDIAADSPIDQRIDQIVGEIVKRERNRLSKSGSSGKLRWVYTAYGWQLVQSGNTDDDDDSPSVVATAPAPIAAPAPYYPAPAQAPQLYYVPSHHRPKYLVR